VPACRCCDHQVSRRVPLGRLCSCAVHILSPIATSSSSNQILRRTRCSPRRTVSDLGTSEFAEQTRTQKSNARTFKSCSKFLDLSTFETVVCVRAYDLVTFPCLGVASYRCCMLSTSAAAPLQLHLARLQFIRTPLCTYIPGVIWIAN